VHPLCWIRWGAVRRVRRRTARVESMRALPDFALPRGRQGRKSLIDEVVWDEASKMAVKTSSASACCAAAVRSRQSAPFETVAGTPPREVLDEVPQR
jgi:hypothetical protein